MPVQVLMLRSSSWMSRVSFRRAVRSGPWHRSCPQRPKVFGGQGAGARLLGVQRRAYLSTCLCS